MQQFTTSYFYRLIQQDLNPFTGTKVKVHDDYLELKQRNWYLISVDTSNIYFKNVIGVTVDKHLFGADVVFRLKGDNNYVANGFSKQTSNKIRDIVKQAIKGIEAKSNNEIIKGINSKLNFEKTSNSPKSVVQELKDLKELLDSDVLTQEEFDNEKKKILSQN